MGRTDFYSEIDNWDKDIGINDCTPNLPDDFKLNEYPNEYPDYYSKVNDWNKRIGINDCTPNLPDDFNYPDYYSKVNDWTEFVKSKKNRPS